jgi:hypothetical protein
MLRVDYGRDEKAIDKRIREFLEERSFDLKLAQSKTYCRTFFCQLNDDNRKVLLAYLSEFAYQPFVKIKTVAPDLISKFFSAQGVYLYWVNASFLVPH